MSNELSRIYGQITGRKEVAIGSPDFIDLERRMLEGKPALTEGGMLMVTGCYKDVMRGRATFTLSGCVEEGALMSEPPAEPEREEQ